MYRFLHVFDNNILTKLYAFLLCQKLVGHFVSLAVARSTLASLTFCRGKVLPFPAESRKANFQLLEMEYAPSTDELPLLGQHSVVK